VLDVLDVLVLTIIRSLKKNHRAFVSLFHCIDCLEVLKLTGVTFYVILRLKNPCLNYRQHSKQRKYKLRT
jgi:hypothetical protein